jgi:hypothetical protein
MEEAAMPRLERRGRANTFVPDRSGAPANPAWDALWQGRSPGRLAVHVVPGAERISRIKNDCRIDLDDAPHRTQLWNEKWREALTDNLFAIAAQMELPGDTCPALDVPRFTHGQSQGFCDIFGARVERQPDDNYYVHPLPADPGLVREVAPRPPETSVYWGAVEYVRYARGATGGVLPFRNPVMVGPLDAANYLLGSTVLLEWLYAEPETVHHLLGVVTEATIRMMAAIQKAAGGALCGDILPCMRGGFCLCSEVRSLISAEMQEQFDAPYLRRIGEALGPYGIHSCGSWERTIPVALRDPNLRAMHGQVRENDLAELCREVDGRVALSIGRSINVHERFTWPDRESYYRHLLSTVPDGQPFETRLESEADIPLWNRLHQEIRGLAYGWTAPAGASKGE